MSLRADEQGGPSFPPWIDDLAKLLAVSCSDTAELQVWCEAAHDFLRQCPEKYKDLQLTPSTLDANIHAPIAKAAWEWSTRFCPIEVSEKLDPRTQPHGVFPCGRVLQNLVYVADWCRGQVASSAPDAVPAPNQLAVAPQAPLVQELTTDRLVSCAERLLSRLSEYGEFAVTEEHAFTVRTNTLLTSAAFAAFETESELQLLGYGPDYPFAGDADSPGPVVTSSWPSDIFVAIDTLRDFLFRARRGEPGYGKQAAGYWCATLGTKIGDKVFPDFGPWLGRLERAVALLKGPEPQPTLRRFAGRVPLSTEGPTPVPLLNVPLGKQFMVKYLSLHHDGDGALDVELRNSAVTLEWFCVRGTAPPVQISGDEMQLRGIGGHPLSLVFPQVETPTHGIFTVAGLLEPIGRAPAARPSQHPERIVSKRQREPEGPVEGIGDGIDTREIPFEAPSGTPSPIREAYDAVAEALHHAWLVRHREPLTGPAFRDEAKQLSAAYRNGLEKYRQAEIWLRSAADQTGRCAHSDALAAVCRINDACGHVMLGVVPSSETVSHVRAAPGLNLAKLLTAMRQQVSRVAVSVLSRSTEQLVQDRTQAAATSGQEPTHAQLSMSLPAVFVDSLSGRVQRAILSALNGKGRVRIADAMQAAYGPNCGDKSEAFDKAIDRLNARLAASEYRCQICREGKTITLTAL
jgi:hypothetical protein